MRKGPGRIVVRGIAVVMIVISGLIMSRIGWSAWGPESDAGDLERQTRFLEESIDNGAAAEMQALFPEGFFFQHALTGMAETQVAAPDLAAARKHLAALDSAEGTDSFGTGMTPAHGIFQAGWALYLATEIADASQDQADLAEVIRRAGPVDAALAGSETGFLEGYPDQYWPCDSVVAAAALARAHQLSPNLQWLDNLRSWRDRVAQFVDPSTGLLPHRVDAQGRALEPPRGSSQSIIQTFWPDVSLALDGEVDHEQWNRFTGQFVVREAGLVGVREYPRGSAGSGDVDSGPLVFGVSASASAVTLAAARRTGDLELASSLSREAELLGLGISWGDQRRYALGLLPVGDAFLAFARSRPAGEVITGSGPRPLWIGLLLPWLAPIAGGVAIIRRSALTSHHRKDGGHGDLYSD